MVIISVSNMSSTCQDNDETMIYYIVLSYNIMATLDNISYPGFLARSDKEMQKGSSLLSFIPRERPITSTKKYHSDIVNPQLTSEDLLEISSSTPPGIITHEYSSFLALENDITLDYLVQSLVFEDGNQVFTNSVASDGYGKFMIKRQVPYGANRLLVTFWDGRTYEGRCKNIELPSKKDRIDILSMIVGTQIEYLDDISHKLNGNPFLTVNTLERALNYLRFLTNDTFNVNDLWFEIGDIRLKTMVTHYINNTTCTSEPFEYSVNRRLNTYWPFNKK